MQETSFDDLGDTVLYSPTELSTLVLRKRLLPYGLYKFRLNVSMDGEIGIENVTTIMVRIVKSDLVAKIAGGSFVRRKWGINITIDAIDGTYDPDVGESDKSNFTFRWFCRRLCETWPEYNDNFSMILAPFTSNCTYDTLNGADEGGCFKYDGVESAGELNATTGVEIFDTTNWYELDVVEMMVVVTKDDRMQVMRQAINVTLGDPPEIELSCVSNCKAKVNPLYPFTVKSKILKAGLAQYSYIWDIVKASPGVDPYTVPPWDPNVWQRYAKGTGRETADIFLDTGIFTAADVGMRLFMRCRAWRTGRADNYGNGSFP
ncbi:sperm receptor for egg jelly-like [Lingula anatina]|uniref:Sperm receptor for egg jelly-like n=1 Tax=Lingula anatina TaxID=7574 RepID=A0A1S3IB06_LINAN|nr:sperm receptor for egg jelly-like [Lingula anatina]|eukprot:XP_013395450.1 sperm receptor for egg jelly-like [Lingula anatina]